MEKLCRPQVLQGHQGSVMLERTAAFPGFTAVPEEGWRGPGVGVGRGGGGGRPPAPWTPLVFTVCLPGGLAALCGQGWGLRFAAVAVLGMAQLCLF